MVFPSLISSQDNPTTIAKNPNPPEKDPHDVFLENFEQDLHKYPSTSVKRFSTLSFQDYLRKNSIRSKASSPFEIQQFDFSKYTHLHDFLPDSQNFYRALGLGLIEACLKNSQFTNRLANFRENVNEKRIELSTDSYLYSSEDLRKVFCQRISQLIDLASESNDFLRVRGILLLVDSRDTIFDSAIISLVKTSIDKYLEEKITNMHSDHEENNGSLSNRSLDQHQRRMHMMESGVIGDLMVYIPDIFQVTFVLQTIENKTIKGTVYQPHNKHDCPEIHILNEKYSVYQNFSLLSIIIEKDNKTQNPTPLKEELPSPPSLHIQTDTEPEQFSFHSETSSSSSSDGEDEEESPGELPEESPLETQQINEIHHITNNSHELQFQKPLGLSEDNLTNMLKNSDSFNQDSLYQLNPQQQEFKPKTLKFSNNSLLHTNPDEETVPEQKTPVRQLKTFHIHNAEDFERLADENSRSRDFRVDVKQCSFIERERRPSMKILNEEDELFVSTSRRFERNIIKENIIQREKSISIPVQPPQEVNI